MKSNLALDQPLSNSIDMINMGHVLHAKMPNMTEVSLAEQNWFGSSLLQTSKKYNIRISLKKSSNSGKDKKNAKEKGSQILRHAKTI